MAIFHTQRQKQDVDTHAVKNSSALNKLIKMHSVYQQSIKSNHPGDPTNKSTKTTYHHSLPSSRDSPQYVPTLSALAARTPCQSTRAVHQPFRSNHHQNPRSIHSAPPAKADEERMSMSNTPWFHDGLQVYEVSSISVN